MSSLTDPIGPDLTATLRALKLGKLTATLPERLTLARQHNMPHADFLQLILSDEVARREAGSIALRAKNAGLDPAMRTETWDPTAAIRYDQRLWNELISLRFLDGPHGALILGPVGVGKTHLATALGHIAVRRRRTVVMARADKLFKRLTAAVRRRSGFLWRGRGSGAGDADAGVAGGRLTGFWLAAAPCRRGGALRGCIRGRVPARWGASDAARPSPLSFGEGLGEDRWVDAWRRRAHGKR